MNDITEIAKKMQNVSVLYVEDDTDIRQNVYDLLSNLFAEVTSAVDGMEGLVKYKKGSFDLLITDIKMPKMNGITLIEEIQKINKDQHIIITTAHDETEYQEKFKELNVKSILHKPITFEALMKTLSDIAKIL